MRKNRFIGQDRCYHLVSRLAHRAFFLDDEEKDRAVALMRRVEEFSGVVVLAYAFMSNHFHIFVYVPKAEEIDEAEKGDCHAGRGAASFRSKADPQLDIPEKVGIGLARRRGLSQEPIPTNRCRQGRSTSWHEMLYQQDCINKL